MTSRTVPPVYRVAANVIRPIMRLIAKHDWQGAEHLPPSGGFIAVSNHVTNLDAIVFAHFLYDHGAAPRFLAKHTLFEVPVFGTLLRKAGQIPVRRNSPSARAALGPARQILDDGDCLGIYPEGTFTRDPDLWPMTARPGAVRLALDSGVPIIPVAHWGAQDILGRYSKVPRLLPRKTIHVHAGSPVLLDDLRDRLAGPADPAILREATDRIMGTLTAMLADIRGQEPPARVYDTRVDGDPRAEELARKAARKAARRRERRSPRERARPPRVEEGGSHD